MKNKIFLSLFLLCVLFACKNKKIANESIVNTSSETKSTVRGLDTINLERSHIALDGSTFFRIEKDSVGSNILIEYCDAEIPKYAIKNNVLIHNWGQETDCLNIITTFERNDTLVYETAFQDNSDSKEVIRFFKLDRKGVFWSINDEFFIDSLYLNSIPKIKQPCEDCYDGCD